MPVGVGWEFEVQVPARFYGTFTEGQDIAFSVPALGQEPRRGKVRTIASYFEADSTAFEDDMLRGSLGVTELVFRMSVRFEVAAGESGKVTPGLAAHVDL